MTDLINLNDFKSNDGGYSQYGEVGILNKLLPQIKDPSGFVIEFGAADGLFCSNTAHLWKNGYDALLIESDNDLFESLKNTTKGYRKVSALHAEVENIDDYTSRVADICSIDVDGPDYFIAFKMQVKHKIVIVEYNPTCPPHVDMVGRRPLQGSSAKSICHVMTNKGYTLVAATKTNLFFLRGDHTDKFEHRLEKLFDYSSLNYCVTSFNGCYDMIGEWDFGMEVPANLNLQGPPELKSRVLDGRTKELLRQMQSLEESR